MKQITQQIVISEEQAGQKKRTGPASLEAHILEPLTTAPERKRPAILICPGGGYGHLSDREGQPIAMEFLSMGCHAFLLSYSLAPDEFPYSLLELASAVALIRSHEEDWLVDPEKVIVCGFSAGGHLACSLGALWNREFLYAPLKQEAASIRPDGMILAYPVISAGPCGHAGSINNLLGSKSEEEPLRRLVSLEYQVGSHTPKAFIWHTFTDPSVPVKNSLLLTEALLEHGVNAELHIYPVGCHGLSLATSEVSGRDGRYVEPQCQSWINLVKNWLDKF